MEQHITTNDDIVWYNENNNNYNQPHKYICLYRIDFYWCERERKQNVCTLGPNPVWLEQ